MVQTKVSVTAVIVKKKSLKVQYDIRCLYASSRRNKRGTRQPVPQETSSLVVIFVMLCNVFGFFMQSPATATIKTDYAMSWHGNPYKRVKSRRH